MRSTHPVAATRTSNFSGKIGALYILIIFVFRQQTETEAWQAFPEFNGRLMSP
jgi:hypothetical protein